MERPASLLYTSLSIRRPRFQASVAAHGGVGVSRPSLRRPFRAVHCERMEAQCISNCKHRGSKDLRTHTLPRTFLPEAGQRKPPNGIP
eukprot:gene15734-biopygen6690